MRQQLIIDGVTAGILSNWASQLVVRPGWMASPVTIVYLLCRVLDFPPAKKVCVWWSVAWGMIVRLDKFSKSAVIAIDSPKGQWNNCNVKNSCNKSDQAHHATMKANILQYKKIKKIISIL